MAGQRGRASAERRRAQRWARFSVERRLLKMRKGASQLAAALEEQDGEVQRRLRLAAPALAALLQGQPPSGAATLKRNCALHAQVVPDRDDAPLSEWRQAQKGPRLSAAGAGQPAQPSTTPLRAEAPAFRPGPRLPGPGPLVVGPAAPARAELREPRCVDEVLAELPTTDLALGVQDVGLDVLPEEPGVPLLGVIADTGDRQAEQVEGVQEDQMCMESEFVAGGQRRTGRTWTVCRTPWCTAL